MYVRTATATVAALSAALLTASPLPTADATAADLPASAPAQSASSLPTVVAHMSNSALRLSVGHRLHAGRVIFRVQTKQGSHTLQLLRLHRGYTMQQFGRDTNKAFQGKLRAIRRIDSRVSWLGGATARPGKPGKFAVKLFPANLIAIDQNSPAFTRLQVFGKSTSRPQVRTRSGVSAFSYGFATAKPTLPASGWIRVRDQSDQPHFVVLQRVKGSTTNRMVRRFVGSGLRREPPWALKANTSTGVLSPNRSQAFHVNLPAGKYVIACFWPDDETGMPHITRGMWKLVQVQ